jgi:hypothetical protein
VTKVPGGVFRRFCPQCRKEHLPHSTSCKACTERISEVSTDFQNYVQEQMKKREKAGEEVDPVALTEEIHFGLAGMSDIFNRLVEEKIAESAGSGETVTRSNAQNAVYTMAKRKHIKNLPPLSQLLPGASKLRRAVLERLKIEKRIAEAIEDKPLEERIKLEKELRANMTDEEKQTMDIATARLPEPVEVGASTRRKMEDYLHRARAAGKSVVSTSQANRMLKRYFEEPVISPTQMQESYNIVGEGRGAEKVPYRYPAEMGTQVVPGVSELAAEYGIRPVQSFGQYDVWSLTDIKRLKKLLEQSSLQPSEEGPGGIGKREEIANIERAIVATRSQLETLDALEKAHPEKMSMIFPQRSRLTEKLERLEDKLKAIHKLETSTASSRDLLRIALFLP